MPEVSATIRLLVQEEVTSRMKQARDQMNQLQEKSDQTKASLSGMFKELAGPVASLGVGAAVGMLIKTSVEAASRLEELNNRAKIVFGESFPQAQAESVALAATLHRSDDDILNFASRLTMVAESFGITSDKSRQMGFDLTTLAVDFSKAFGGTQEDAANTITMAMEGATKGLRQYNIVLNDSTLQQYARTKGIKDDTSEMSQAQKALLTYEYLMEKTTDIQAMAAKNTGSLRDRTAEFTDKWDDLMQAMGSPILPAATSLFSGLTTIITDATVSLGGFVKEFQDLGSLINFKSGGYFSGVIDRLHLPTSPGAQSLTDSGFAQPNGAAFDTVSATALKADKNVKGLYGSLADPGRGAKAGADALNKVTDAMKQTGKTYDDVARSVAQKLIDLDSGHKERLSSIRDQIEQTKKSMADLDLQYSRSLDDMDRRDADAIIQSGQNADDLQKKLDELNKKREATINTGGSVSVDMQDEIDQAQAKLDALDAVNAKALAGSSTGVKTQFNARVGQTDLEKQLSDSQKQRDQLKADHTARAAELDEEMKKLQEKQSAEDKAYTAQRTQLELTKTAVQSFVATYTTNMANLDKVTQDTVDSLNKKLDDLKASISSIDALMQARSDLTGGGTLEDKVNQRTAGRLTDLPRFGDGGIVTKPTLAIIGEKGPERITPLSQEKAQSQTVTIGPFYISEKVDMNDVLNQIKRTIKLTSLAAA